MQEGFGTGEGGREAFLKAKLMTDFHDSSYILQNQMHMRLSLGELLIDKDGSKFKTCDALTNGNKCSVGMSHDVWIKFGISVG